MSNDSRLKIAFVNQPFDVIVPPFQNSIGYCSYGLARSLLASCDVTIYGLKDAHPPDVLQACDPRVDLRLIPATLSDRFIFTARTKLGTLIDIASPISTSALLFPEYGRQVAMDLQKHPYDVIHIQHCTQYIPMIRELNPAAKLVLHTHAEWFSQSNFKTLSRRLDHVDYLFTVSDYLQRKAVQAIPKLVERAKTMHCAVDAAEFFKEKDYAQGRQRREKRVLYAGAVSPHKGIHVLLDAFHLVLQEFPDVRLECVGSLHNYPAEEMFEFRNGELPRHISTLYTKHPVTLLRAKAGFLPTDAGTYQASLKSKISTMAANKVLLSGHIGYREDLIERYYDADVVVSPSIHEEGFGLPTLEAMAAGVAVVGTRSGGQAETIKDGETGFLVEKNDAQALAQQMLRLLKDAELRERMGRAARQRVFAGFTWDRVARLAEVQYRRLCTEQTANNIGDTLYTPATI